MLTVTIILSGSLVPSVLRTALVCDALMIVTLIAALAYRYRHG
jgi:hypothetical protein